MPQTRPESSGSESSLESNKTTDGLKCQGCDTYPYKLVIAGGGPAGYSILIRALRLNFANELLSGNSKQDNNSTAGICLIDAGNADRLGGGRLQDYVINSNTFGSKFYSNIMNPQPTNLPPETVSGTSLARFDKVDCSVAGTTLRDISYGKEAPLSLAGCWLRDVAKSVGETISQHSSSSTCVTSMKVTKIQRCKRPTSGNDVVIPTSPNSAAAPTTSDSASSEQYQWRVTAKDTRNDDIHEFYTQKVALATGGRQDLPDLPNAANTAKLVASDFAITSEGIEAMRKMLASAKGKSPSTGRIVIVGGSHSAFSAAWTCLNHLNLPSNNQAEATDKGGAGSCTGIGGQLSAASSVIMLHRSSIRVFYGSRKEAENDDYDNFTQVHRSTGQIHPFGGLRADAKELWKAIRCAKEQRVRLLKIASTSQSLCTKLFDDATVIIWACGYSTNLVDIFDEHGVKVPVRLLKGQVEIDDKARLLLDSSYPRASDGLGGCSSQGQSTGVSGPKDKHLVDVFGIGLGYGHKATLDGDPTGVIFHASIPPRFPQELDGSSGRADGVAVYLKRGATLILSALLGCKVFGAVGEKQLTSWEERTLALKKDEISGVGSPLKTPKRVCLTPPLPSPASTQSPVKQRQIASSGAMVSGSLNSSAAKSSLVTVAGSKSLRAAFVLPALSRSSPDPMSGNGKTHAKPSIAHVAPFRRSLDKSRTDTVIKAETVFLEAGRLAASVERLSKPRASSSIAFAQGSTATATATAASAATVSPIAPKTKHSRNSTHGTIGVFSPLVARSSTAVGGAGTTSISGSETAPLPPGRLARTSMLLRPMPLVLPGLTNGRSKY